mmetsp:Transcript_8009/g.14688  ORF Transcript_8009/g.14688 Transcript_8009/m.14688 type:complete len:1998 (+) Transcript_8009:47-6040(+)
MSLKLFLVQVGALTKKNVYLQIRNRTSTATQLFIGVFFLLLLLVMDKAVQQSNGRNQFMKYSMDPETMYTDALVKCTVPDNCLDFVYSPERSIMPGLEGELNKVVGAIQSRVGGGSTRGFENKTVMLDWIRANPNRTRVAVYFQNVARWGTDEDFKYVVLLNETRTCESLGVFHCDFPIADIGIPFQAAIDASFAEVFTQTTSTAPNIEVWFSDFAHPDLPANFDVMAEFGSSFLYIAISFNYVIQLSLIVEEKQLHLVEAMKQMGMMYSAYWASWLIINCVVNTLMITFLIMFGALFSLDIFTDTAFGLLVSFFWLSSMSFTSLAFLFSTLTRATSTARLLGIGVFIITFISCPIVVPLLLNDGSEDYDLVRVILTLFPFFSFYQVLGKFIAESSGESNLGMEWGDRLVNILPSDPDNAQGDSFWSVETTLIAMIKGFFLLSILAWYLDHVIPTEHGHREPFHFFLKPSFWFPSMKTGRKSKVTPAVKSSATSKTDDDLPQDPDVRAEAERVRSQNYDGRQIAVEISRLWKTFTSGLFSRHKFSAVRGIEFAIEKDSVFVMLGHNGAGKTTTFNMLTGLSNVSKGDATIFGLSVVNDMKKIQSTMGVCPQHDILFNQLTGREHLRLFAKLKGLQPDQVDEEVERRLKQTLLTDAGDQPSWTYSGGMKRRLSIAIALIGDPKIVFLDEPTTGMDPGTRRQVWDMIAEAKKGRVIVLTTHSMEEAGVLGDRIGVMSHGAIQAIGTSLRLKSRFGSGYHLTIVLNTPEDKTKTVSLVQDDKALQKALMEFAQANAPEGTTLEGNLFGDTVTVNLPRVDDVSKLVSFFQLLESSKDDLNIKDFSLSQSTLEEVFLNLSKLDNFISKTNEEKKLDEVEREYTRVGALMQFKALFLKSCTYQLKNTKSCCIIVLFPVFVMLMLLMVEQVVFKKLRMEIVCGKNMTETQCLESGIDISCVERLSKLSFPSNPKGEVGRIKAGHGSRGNINPNCNSLGCFEGLETANYEAIPLLENAGQLGALGALEMDLDPTLKEWHHDLRFMLVNSTCDDAFFERFDEYDGCEDQAPDGKLECQTQVRALQRARAYINSENGTRATGSLTDLCGSGSSNNGIVAPPDEDVRTVHALEKEREACTSDQFKNLWAHFLAMPPIHTASRKAKGVLGNFTSKMFYQEPLEIFADSIVRLAMGSEVAMLQILSAGGQIPSNLQDLCDPSLGPAFKTVISESLGHELNVTGIYNNICGFITNIDLVRGLSFDLSYTSREDLRKRGQFDKWYGEEYQTAFMKSQSSKLAAELKYLERTYLSHWNNYEFRETNPETHQYKYTAFYNNSATRGKMKGNWQALVWAMDNAIVRSITGHGISVQTERFPIPFECNRDAWLRKETTTLKCDLLPRILSLSILDFFAITLFPYLLMIQMFVVVSLVVYEKENRLRVAMKMMGLGAKVYWAVNFLFYFGQYWVMIFFMWQVGAAANIQIFTLHDPSVLFRFFFTWGVLLVVYSFFLSVFFSSSKTSTAATFLFMLILNTTGTSLLQTLTEDPNSTEASFVFLMLIAPLVMIRTLLWLGLAGAFNEQLTAQNINVYANGIVGKCINYMWPHIFVTIVLLWYLEKVLPVGFGVPEHPLFFIQKRYWKAVMHELSGTFSNVGKGNVEAERSLEGVQVPKGFESLECPPDVADEHERAVDVKSAAHIRVARLHKRFGSTKTAVKSISLAINKKECFALLGHNGAGKTTLLSMLCGLFPPTSGDALVNGNSILTDLGEIHKQMGVCPQHDILWESLSARDHLRFYGRLKGLSGKRLKDDIEKALVDVNLAYAGNRPAGRFSGGMKRRLSVAIALIGNPSVVYLDEPSTGLDPASKHQLWDVIQKAKGNKSIILTTHGMEEADVLGDRLGIMGGGVFQCIGTSTDLKKRYGAGYTFTLTTSCKDKESDNRIMEFVKTNWASAELRNQPINGTFNFEILHKDVQFSQFFEIMEKSKQQLGIVDWGISETTLEEVFLRLAKASQ